MTPNALPGIRQSQNAQYVVVNHGSEQTRCQNARASSAYAGAQSTIQPTQRASHAMVTSCMPTKQARVFLHTNRRVLRRISRVTCHCTTRFAFSAAPTHAKQRRSPSPKLAGNLKTRQTVPRTSVASDPRQAASAAGPTSPGRGHSGQRAATGLRDPPARGGLHRREPSPRAQQCWRPPQPLQQGREYAIQAPPTAPETGGVAGSACHATYSRSGGDRGQAARRAATGRRERPAAGGLHRVEPNGVQGVQKYHCSLFCAPLDFKNRE